ncbi:hypothetical protein [Dyella sp.]|uniref:hypothetical protein n=1 Tax=Dyella sp. TaxID=1869338 RepID=UPI002ED691D4
MKSGSRLLTPRTAGCLLLALPMAAASMTAFADDDSSHSPALDRVSIWVGGYYAKTDTNIGANDKSDTLRGHVNLEDALGFNDHKTVPRARLDLLLGEHQGLSFDYYTIDRDRSKTLNENVNFGGNDFLASARVKGKLDFDFGSAAYRWWFGTGSDVFGVGLGAAYYGVHARISGEATAEGQTAQATGSYSDNAWAPMLQLGWRHAFSDHLRMYIDASGVKKNGSDLGGHIYNGALGVEWFPWQNVGFGAEYNYTRIKLHQDHHNFDDSLDMKLNGPSAYVRFRF